MGRELSRICFAQETGSKLIISGEGAEQWARNGCAHTQNGCRNGSLARRYRSRVQLRRAREYRPATECQYKNEWTVSVVRIRA
jgi:hypothetical protein